MALDSRYSHSAAIARRRGRLVLLFAIVVLLIGLVSFGTADAQDDCGGLFRPPCPDEPTPTTDPTTTPTTEPPSTTETTGIATTVVPETSTTTTTTTTTTVATTEAAPSQSETTAATEPPTTTTSAPPEAAPQAPTTTIEVGELRRITQNTPDLTGVMVLWILGLFGTTAVLAVGFYRHRLRRN